MNTASLAATPSARPAPAEPVMPSPKAAPPWWRHGHVWLLIAGPAVVVLASIATLILAVRQPDPVVAEDYYRRGIEINKTLAARETAAKALLPAVQARNHAASPAPAELIAPPQGAGR